MKTLCRERTFLAWEEGKRQVKGKKVRNLAVEQLLRNKNPRVLGIMGVQLLFDD